MINIPINIPEDLPAKTVLENENIFVMTHRRAESQDIRPLRIVILNLMPTKSDTEIQLLRLLSNTPLQIDITLAVPSTHESKNTSSDYLKRFYRRFGDIKEECFDGMIITGAPLENLRFEDVDFWDEMCTIMDWCDEHVFSTMYICWAAFAGLYHHHGIGKRMLDKKFSGIFPYDNISSTEPLLRGIDDHIRMPQSRYAAVTLDDIDGDDRIRAVAVRDRDIGIAVSNRDVYITGHLEYDRDTLRKEYERDIGKGLAIQVPENYFPDDDPTGEPELSWRSQATLVFTNWLNYYVYQQTPYDIGRVGLERKGIE